VSEKPGCKAKRFARNKEGEDNMDDQAQAGETSLRIVGESAFTLAGLTNTVTVALTKAMRPLCERMADICDKIFPCDS
jgi:hypothetical protein